MCVMVVAAYRMLCLVYVFAACVAGVCGWSGVPFNVARQEDERRQPPRGHRGPARQKPGAPGSPPRGGQGSRKGVEDFATGGVGRDTACRLLRDLSIPIVLFIVVNDIYYILNYYLVDF